MRSVYLQLCWGRGYLEYLTLPYQPWYGPALTQGERASEHPLWEYGQADCNLFGRALVEIALGRFCPPPGRDNGHSSPTRPSAPMTNHRSEVRLAG